MKTRTFRLSEPVVRTGKVIQVEGMFDVPEASHTTTDVEVLDPATLEEKPWNVGLIVGPSGSGKSTVVREMFGMRDDPQWEIDRAIVDQFEAGSKETVAMLTAVGLGSPPSWLRPYRSLSTGEQFRANVARSLATSEDPIVIDEFTSVVDRTVAQVASHAIQKAVRREGKRLVCVSCHFDLEQWLQPDWIYRPDTVDFEWRRLQPHPPVDLEITTLPRSAWRGFSRYHYLSATLHSASKCYGAFIGDECVAFNAHIPFPHPSRKNIRMGHRLVVLPDYQGLGIGGAFDDWLGQQLWDSGYRYHKTISHPALIHYYAKSPRWKALSRSRAVTLTGMNRMHKQNRSSRKLATRSFMFVAPAVKRETVTQHETQPATAS